MIDLDALVLKPCQDTWGRPISYVPATGAPYSISGVFDKAYSEPQLVEGMQVTVTMPVVGVRLAELKAFPVQQKDKVIIDGVTYLIREPRDDGHGNIKLMLNEVAV